MYFDTLQGLLIMDGHGFYVWTAYVVTVVVITLVLLSPVRRKKRFLRQLSGELKRAQGATGRSGEVQ